jgi:hypothetical protein
MWWILLVFEAIGLWGQTQVGNGRWWGWAVVLLHSIPWFVFCLVDGLWGAALMPPLWWIVNLRNLRKWKVGRVTIPSC